MANEFQYCRQIRWTKELNLRSRHQTYNIPGHPVKPTITKLTLSSFCLLTEPDFLNKPSQSRWALITCAASTRNLEHKNDESINTTNNNNSNSSNNIYIETSGLPACSSQSQGFFESKSDSPTKSGTKCNIFEKMSFTIQNNKYILCIHLQHRCGCTTVSIFWDSQPVILELDWKRGGSLISRDRR